MLKYSMNTKYRADVMLHNHLMTTISQEFALLSLHNISSLVRTAHVSLKHNIFGKTSTSLTLFTGELNREEQCNIIELRKLRTQTFLARTRSSACSNSVSMFANCWTEVTLCSSCSSARYSRALCCTSSFSCCDFFNSSCNN